MSKKQISTYHLLLSRYKFNNSSKHQQDLTNKHEIHVDFTVIEKNMLN